MCLDSAVESVMVLPLKLQLNFFSDTLNLFFLLFDIEAKKDIFRGGGEILLVMSGPPELVFLFLIYFGFQYLFGGGTNFIRFVCKLSNKPVS